MDVMLCLLGLLWPSDVCDDTRGELVDGHRHWFWILMVYHACIAGALDDSVQMDGQ
jgi:hypothetical protein